MIASKRTTAVKWKEICPVLKHKHIADKTEMIMNQDVVHDVGYHHS